MNKVTLSVAALAAIAVPVQAAQVLTGDAKKAAIEDVQNYINEAKRLVSSFGYSTVCQPFQDKLDKLLTDFSSTYDEGETDLTNEICISNKLAAQAAVDEASNAKKPYEVKDELKAIKDNLIKSYSQVESRIQGDANYSAAFKAAKITALNEYMEGRAATDKLPAIVGLDQIKLDSYDLKNDKIVQDRQTIKDQLAVISYALDNTFSKKTLDAEYANNTNDAAFNHVNSEIARVEGVITAKFNAFRELFPLEETVWTDWYDDAFTKLGAYQQDLKKVAQYNKEAHESADEKKNALALQSTNLTEVGRIEGLITALYEKYAGDGTESNIGLKQTEVNAYNAVNGLITNALGELDKKLKALHDKNINVTLIDSQINQLKTDINTFKTNKLEAAYKAHQAKAKQGDLTNEFNNTVLQNYSAGNGYSYSQLKSYADALVKNKKDYNEMISDLDKKIKALDDAKKKAAEASKVDKSYNPAAHFTTEYNRIKDTLIGGEKTKLANDLNAVNPVAGKYPNTSYKNDATNGIEKAKTTIQTAIDNYAAGTAKALEYFNAAKETYNKNNKLYGDLVKTATNTSVTIDGLAVTETTYADYIAQVKGELDALDTAIATANGKNDFTHRDEMEKASKKTIDGKIEALTKGYDVNAKNWNQNVKMANAENTYAAVSGDLKALKDRVKAIEDNLNGTNYGDTDGALKCELAVAIQKSISTINTTKDTGINAVNNDIEDLYKKYNDLGIDDANIAKKLEAADKVTAKKDAWNKLISDIATKVEKLEADAKVAAENKSAYDVLAAKASATSDGKSNVAYAIDNTLTKITNHYATNGIDYPKDSGWGYYKYLLNVTKRNKLTEYRTNIEKSYKAGKMVADAESKNYDGQLNNLKSDVEGQYMKAINNLDKYQTQCKRIEGTPNDKGVNVGGLEQTYEAVLALVKADQTSAAADMLKQLATAKSELEALLALVNTNYAQGKCDTENSNYEKTFNEISDKIEAVRNQQSKWPDVLRQDNLNEHNDFLNVSFKSAKDKFDEAVSIINEFSAIKNKSVKEALKKLVNTHKAIFDYADSLRVLQVNENAAFEANKALTDPTLYVATEYKNKAKDFVAGIDAKLQEYCEGVNKEAWNECQVRLTHAYNEISTAQKYVKDNYKSKDAIANAFADLKTTVNGALGAAAGSTKDSDIKNFVNGGSFDAKKCDRRFAAIVDESFEELEEATFDAALAAAKVDVAQAEYNWTYQHAIDSYNAEYNAISAITNPAVDKDDYLAKIKDLKEKNIDAGKKQYDEYNGNNLFKDVVNIAAKTNCYFDNTKDVDDKGNYTWKSKPYKDVLDLLNNLEYQASIQAIVDAGEKKIDDYADELEALFSAHIEGNSLIYDDINKMYSDLYAFDVANAVVGDEAKENVDKYVNKNGEGSIDAQMAAIRTQAITLEITTLENEVQRVKEQYNNAFKEIGVGFDADHKYANKIEDLRVRLNNEDAAETEGYVKGYKEKWNGGVNPSLSYAQAYQQLLGVQREIAELSSDIASEYKDGEAISNAAALLAQKSAEVEAVVSEVANKIHQFAAIEAEVGADIDKLVEDLAGVDENVALKNADETVLFYKLNFITDYDRILASCNDLWTGKISVSSALTVEDAYARYKTNNDNYNTLISNLDNVIVAKYNAVKSEVDAFEFSESVFKEWDGMNKVFEHWTTAEERKLDKAVDDYRQDIEKAAADINLESGATAKRGITNPNSSKFNTTKLSADIATFEKDAKYKEASKTYLPNIQNTLDYVNIMLSYNKFTPNTKWQLESECSELNYALNNADYYNYIVNKWGSTDKDIDGNYIEIIPPTDPTDPDADPSPKWFKKDYVTEVWPEVKAKAAELQTAANDLLARVQANSYILGDVDHDGKVTIIDYARVRNMILSGITYEKIADEVVRYAADATQDQNINVADLSKISSFIFGDNPNNAAAARAALFASDFSAENKISAAIESEETTIFGKTVRMAVNVESGVAFTAGQFDVKLPAGMKLVGASVSERGNGHEVLTGDLENGMKRVVVSVVENNSFYGNSGTLVYLDVEVASDFNGGNIELSDAIFTDGRANSYRLTNNGPVVPTGIDGVEAATAKERIYSVGGQMMKAVKKGLNIIVGENNKTQKVVNNK